RAVAYSSALIPVTVSPRRFISRKSFIEIASRLSIEPLYLNHQVARATRGRFLSAAAGPGPAGYPPAVAGRTGGNAFADAAIALPRCRSSSRQDKGGRCRSGEKRCVPDRAGGPERA